MHSHAYTCIHVHFGDFTCIHMHSPLLISLQLALQFESKERRVETLSASASVRGRQKRPVFGQVAPLSVSQRPWVLKCADEPPFSYKFRRGR